MPPAVIFLLLCKKRLPADQNKFYGQPFYIYILLTLNTGSSYSSYNIFLQECEDDRHRDDRDN